MAEALLRAFFNKYVDEEFKLYNDGQRCYSSVMYVRKRYCPGSPAELAEKFFVLKQYGAQREVFYALMRPQPDDAVGMPPDIEAAKKERKLKNQRDAELEAAH